MRIALITCSDLPGWEIDDQPLHVALRGRDVEIVEPIWDDPTVDWSSFDAGLIRTTWDYTGKYKAFVSWAESASTQTRLYNPAHVIRWNTHKGYLRELEEKGVRIAPTLWFSKGQSVDIEQSMAAKGWTRGFLKPMVGATAQGTLRFHCDTEGLTAAQQHLDRTLETADFMLQPYLTSVETTGELTALFFDGELSHTVQKIPVKGDYRVQDDFGAWDGPVTFSAEQVACARNAVKTAEEILGLEEPLLYARVDFLVDDAGRLCLNELELVEPSLFLRHDAKAGERLADALLRRL
ncbi:MAG: hypothetical protein CMH54_14895 [Myxococcales bacterium]|nr:hypothetical protein [Myxococcales bacterium]